MKGYNINIHIEPSFRKCSKYTGSEINYERQLAIKYKFLVARGQIVVAKNSPSLFFK